MVPNTNTPNDLINQLRAAVSAEYQIDGYLDAGGQGAVFRGRYQNQEVALKVFAPTPDLQRSLDREIVLLQNLNHPNIVKIHRATTVVLNGSTCPLVAYEFLHGGDLRKHLAANAEQLTKQQILALGEEVASGIEALWLHRIVHRDIKPANIVDGGTKNVLVDVGFARHVDRSNLTLVGHVAGTPGYMSPEQARGRRNLTINSDIFSLGVTLYQLATRRHPFQQNQGLIGSTSPTPLSSLRSDLPPTLTGFIDQMMSVVPAQRPSNLAFRFNQLRLI
jgi:serine/threonine protein kinase